MLTACGDGEPVSSALPAPPTTAPAGNIDLSGETFTDLTGSTEAEVGVFDNSFRAPYIEVKAGTTITFANGGRTAHNVLPVVPSAFPTIEAEDLDPKAQASITLEEAGDYPYYCSLHGTKTKGMVGAIRVVE